MKSRRSNNQSTKPSSPNAGSLSSIHFQTSLSPHLGQNEFEIYICFARRYLKRGAPLDLALQGTQLNDIRASRNNSPNEQLFHSAFLTFSVIVFGAQHREISIMEKGYVMRGTALKQLNLALSDPQCYTRNDVILAVITLALLDCIIPAGSGHYLKHMIGLQTLLDLRGPNSLGTHKASWLHKTVQQMILFASLRLGRPSILAKDEWKDVLKAEVSTTELEEQELLDILAECTILNAPQDLGVASKQATSDRNIVENKQKALDLLDRLRTWKTEWARNIKNSHNEIPMPVEWQTTPQESTNDLSLGHPSTCLDISDESANVMFMFYNTALIYVFRVLNSLGGCPDDSTTIQPKGDAAKTCDQLRQQTECDYAAAELFAALDIYRCLPVYSERLSSSRAINTAPNVAWAVSTAWDTLGGQASAYGRRMKDLLLAKDQNLVAQGLWSH